MSAVRMNRNEKSFQRALAMESAKTYCKENGLTWERLATQRFDLLGAVAVFSQPSAAKAEGLTNDQETMPKPTLVIRFQDGHLVFEQTEHTREYLS